MKLNKDLLDALMMLGLICIVLIGTTEFDNETVKTISLVVLAVVNLGLAALRMKAPQQSNDEEQNYQSE
ncbi:hypothetical protein [Parabacteroides pacaensis]|uniref:hypothetical protein n=1 Tax=Parabacteroides pacaensis TaxID=2086575 RepID=UPI000D10B9BA|nr:hypothetical protein [Parabacteroides pacaensis]